MSSSAIISVYTSLQYIFCWLSFLLYLATSLISDVWRWLFVCISYKLLCMQGCSVSALPEICWWWWCRYYFLLIEYIIIALKSGSGIHTMRCLEKTEDGSKKAHITLGLFQRAGLTKSELKPELWVDWDGNLRVLSSRIAEQNYFSQVWAFSELSSCVGNEK